MAFRPCGSLRVTTQVTNLPPPQNNFKKMNDDNEMKSN